MTRGLLALLALFVLVPHVRAQPLVYWNFETNGHNQGSGGALYNATLTGNPEFGWTGGTVSRADGTSVRPGGISGGGVNLVDIDNDQLGLAAGTAQLGNNFAISSWYYLSPNSGNGSTRYFVFESTPEYDVSFGNSSGDTFASYVGQSFVNSTLTPREAWHHVLHSFSSNGTTTTLSVYVDGVLIGSGNAATSAVNFPSLIVGNARASAGDRQWDGVLDEFAVWNNSLSAAAATEVYHKGVLGLPLLGQKNVDGVGDNNVDISVAAAGWAAATFTPTTGANNDLGDGGFNAHYMRTQGAGDNTITVTYSDLPEHNAINLGMLVAQLDSLDPNRDGDRFIVRVDGNTILSAGLGYGTSVNGSFSDLIVTTGDPALDAELLSLRTIAGANVDGDANFLENVYDLSGLSLFQMIPHTGDTLVLEIVGRQNQSSGEFFALDNLSLELLLVPEPTSLGIFAVAAVFALATMLRRSRSRGK